MPFQSNSYKDVVKKNSLGIVNFDFSSYKVKVSKESLLTSDESAQRNA